MITVVPFKVAHVIYLDVDEYVLKQCRELGFEQTKALCQLYEDSGYSFTALKAGVPIACAGIYNNWAWFLLDSKRAKGLTLKLIKALIQGIEILQQETNQEIYAHVDLDYPRNARFLELLGFEPTDNLEIFVRRPAWV